ncbi:unnamed protein product [Didymodactylos carnosus]|uniref:EF-hand domain-containing protein n=1 Tax=Didymodactylos carnosus TaxID=1234261 RepID=A0A814YIK0_9BILA|nr:unnamed protein product [Didymodactylos carnosus]CAF1230017.1 unnamed protein product [Didymodactylos carnosus]CAF3833094.1 unnamed protein product [Didymodactylos carnosus]CAF3992706.1 unnamed protein product [Didymodactylos carnosus]
MGNKITKNIPPLHTAVLKRIHENTDFLPNEIQYFHYDFHKYAPNGQLTLVDFEKFYKLLFRRGNSERFAKYVFDAYDINMDNIVDFEEFIMGLYNTTKADSPDKIRWAFDLCDRDCDNNLDINEIENVVEALYEMSEYDMPRQETYMEALDRIKHLFLGNEDNDDLVDSVSKTDFVNIVEKDVTIMGLIECKTNINKKRKSQILSKKQLNFKQSKQKSFSDMALPMKK